MKYIRKSISVMLVAAILTIFTFSNVSAQSKLIYETSSKETITSGVTLENIVRFTDDGWLNINVLRVDLSNEYVKVDTISNSDSIQKLASVKSLASTSGAVAAINASFFNPTTGGNGYPDGPIVESGKIISAWSDYNRYGNIMGSFSIDNLNKLLYTYWKTNITLIAPSGNSTAVMQYNKPSRDSYNDFTILDRRWGTASIGASSTYPDIVEMVVDDGKVSEIREGMPATQIPENGYVVVTRQAGGSFLKNNFQGGDSVGLDIATNPDWNNLKMSVTGGSILLKDGKIPSPFSFDIPYISKKQPRTVIGSTADGKELILVTVDGRQNSSIGLTQAETAQLMLQLGAYNALNLDGGGSTTMVARTPATKNLNVVNSPSDGSNRAVSNAIGIFSIAPPASLGGLIIDAEASNVFVGTSRSFSVRGYDRYFNPISVSADQVNWSVTGIKGYFVGNVFYPASVGEGKIIAKVGDISAELPISSLSAPVKLTLNKKSINLPINKTQGFYVMGVNKNGYSALINPGDINWSLKGNIGQLEKNVFTATTGGTGYIDASIGNVHAYCSVSVAADKTLVVDNFESSNGSFTSYPNTVYGSYNISGEQVHSGKSSGKLTYDFSNTEGTRAAYMVFSNNKLVLQPSTTKIGVWVYNDHENSNWLRGEVYDSKGQKHLVDFTKSFDWTGWHYVETSLDGIDSPTLLTKLYLAQVNPVSDTGSIYLDDLTVVSSSYPAIDTAKTPQDTLPSDEANKSVEYKKSDTSFRFSVFGQQQEPGTPLEKLLTMKFADKINNYIEAAAIVGSGIHSMAKTINKPLVSTNTGYKALDIKNSRFIQLDMSKQGLRLSNAAQWHWFLDQLNSAKGNNVFIFLSDNPQAFSDGLEAKLFKDTLVNYRKSTNKNVWVFYKGDKNTSYMERGIKYLSTAGYEIAGLTPGNTDIAQYILVTVNGNNVTYVFKPIV